MSKDIRLISSNWLF